MHINKNFFKKGSTYRLLFNPNPSADALCSSYLLDFFKYWCLQGYQLLHLYLPGTGNPTSTVCIKPSNFQPQTLIWSPAFWVEILSILPPNCGHVNTKLRGAFS